MRKLEFPQEIPPVYRNTRYSQWASLVELIEQGVDHTRKNLGLGCRSKNEAKYRKKKHFYNNIVLQHQQQEQPCKRAHSMPTDRLCKMRAEVVMEPMESVESGDMPHPLSNTVRN